MSTTAEAAQKPALDIRYAQVGLLQMKLRTIDPGAILDELTGKLASAPQFFQQTAICLDLRELETEPGVAQMREVVEAVRRGGMRVIGLTEGPASASLAQAMELPVIAGFRSQGAATPRPAAPSPPAAAPPAAAASAPAPSPAPVAAAAPAPPALIHTQPVRSGQRLYARERDLVITASVGAGAEVMADGCVHIYGALRGRAMAGVRGDTGARVFVHEFRPELIAVAGVFRIFEQMPAELAGHPVQALLVGEELRLARLDG